MLSAYATATVNSPATWLSAGRVGGIWAPQARDAIDRRRVGSVCPSTCLGARTIRSQSRLDEEGSPGEGKNCARSAPLPTVSFGRFGLFAPRRCSQIDEPIADTGALGLS